MKVLMILQKSLSYIVLGILCLLGGSSGANAQFSLVPSLPSECRTEAQSTANEISTNNSMCAIGAITYGDKSLKVGFDLETGKAGIWGYFVHYVEGDSTRFLPYTKLLGGCVDPSAFVADLRNIDVPTEDFGILPLPDTFLMGTNLIAKLKADGDFVAYRNTYPDSLVNIAAITRSTLTFNDYPSGTPFWIITFNSSPAGSGQTAPGMTCYVHALNGETVCVEGNITSVDTHTEQINVSASPNPANDVVYAQLPADVLGRRCTIDLVSTTGMVVPVSDMLPVSNSILVPTSGVPSGVYALRIQWHGKIATAMIAITH